ncbi:MAG: hypothetical protein IH852_07355 [Bacteroidetes bacterium]|nr:hypothetical protein [Bacteroidota bacterium]
MKKGWISIHRELTEHWLWEDKPFSNGQAFIDMLLECNHKSKEVRIGNEIVYCNRGESIKSLDTWAKRWGWNKSRVRRFLKLLEKANTIETKKARNTTYLSICNYDNYQGNQNENETKVKRIGNKPETNLTPNNNDNNDNNGSSSDPPQLQIVKLFAIWGRASDNGEKAKCENLLKQFGWEKVWNAFHRASEMGKEKKNLAYVKGILTNPDRGGGRFDKSIGN